MDFAKTQLEKYGWKEGEGLGKHKHGISAPLKTSLKLNSFGIGYNAADEFTNNWWERVYNEAASNIQPVKEADGSVREVATNGEVDISTKKRKKKNKHNQKELTYGAFKKKSCLNGARVDHISESDTSSEDESTFTGISDEQLFAICGGRTGHKGSRHGLTLSGKLARLQKHESGSLAAVATDEPNEIEKSTKKKRKKGCKTKDTS